jgi:outer membrane protein assembly factor BamB
MFSYTFLLISTLLLSGRTVIKAQNVTIDEEYFDGSAITVAWEAATGQVDRGNGAFMSPSGTALIVVRVDGIVQAFHPKTGTEVWMYSPPDPTISKSFGGAFFSSYGGQDYILYSVTTNANVPSEATRYVDVS